jgi:predicted RNA-binding protein with PUA-like domain
MPSFLFKTEPSTYSWDDLVRDGRATWDGVANPKALANLRAVRPGDRVLIYHSGKEKSAVGLARATSAAYPDPKLGDPKRVVVDIAPDGPLARPVPLAAFKADAILKATDLVRISRLSVVTLDAAQFARALELAGKASK